MNIYVAGHRGMVGAAIVRELARAMPSAEVVVRTRAELDLLNQTQVYDFLANEQPDYVFVAAAKVGGIHANEVYRAEFIYENLMIEANLIHGAYLAGIQNLMFLGSSCIYPRDCPQPIREEYLLSGPLEQTNEPYALAKITGIKLCENYNRQYGKNYVALMPTNLYGTGDNYDLNNCHVIPALIRKAHQAKTNHEKSLSVWGTAQVRRDFLYVDDVAAACVHFMRKSLTGGPSFGATEIDAPCFLNIGSGRDLTIAELAEVVMKVVRFQGRLSFDRSKPDGTPRKLLDVSRANDLGWRAKVGLEEGIRLAYADFLSRGVVQ